MISERLKEARKQLGVTQKKFAEIAGLPLPSHKDYISGKTMPGGDALIGYSKAGININWLLTGVGTMFTSRNEVDPEIMDEILIKLISAEHIMSALAPLGKQLIEPLKSCSKPEDIPAELIAAGIGKLREHFIAEYKLAGHIYNNVCHINNKATRERTIEDQIKMINVVRDLEKK